MRHPITRRPLNWRWPMRLPFKNPDEMWWTLTSWAVAAILIAFGFIIIHSPG